MINIMVFELFLLYLRILKNNYMSTRKRITKIIDGVLYQQCRQCKEWYIAGLENFTKDNRSPIGYTALCRKCKGKSDKQYHAKIKKDPEKWAEHLKKSNERKKKNPNTRIGWTEYNNRPEVKERKLKWAREHMIVKALTDDQYRLKMWRNAKKRAADKRIPFEIEVNDIVIPEKCPLLETPLTRGEHTRWENPENTISLDRIVPEKGYVKGNVRVISTLANTMKNNATIEQLLTFSKNIISYINGEDIVRTIENNESIEIENKESQC